MTCLLLLAAVWDGPPPQIPSSCASLASKHQKAGAWEHCSRLETSRQAQEAGRRPSPSSTGGNTCPSIANASVRTSPRMVDGFCCVKQTVERVVRVPRSALEVRSVLGSGGERRRVGRSLVGSLQGPFVYATRAPCHNHADQPTARSGTVGRPSTGGFVCTHEAIVTVCGEHVLIRLLYFSILQPRKPCIENFARLEYHILKGDEAKHNIMQMVPIVRSIVFF